MEIPMLFFWHIKEIPFSKPSTLLVETNFTCYNKNHDIGNCKFFLERLASFL